MSDNYLICELCGFRGYPSTTLGHVCFQPITQNDLVLRTDQRSSEDKILSLQRQLDKANNKIRELDFQLYDRAANDLLTAARLLEEQTTKATKLETALEVIAGGEGSVRGFDKDNIEVDADYELSREEMQKIAKEALGVE